MRKSFVLYTESLNVLDFLTDEQSGKLFKAIRNYVKNGSLPEDQMIRIAFSNIKDYLDKDGKIYEERCKRGRENGKFGGRPRKEKETDKTNIGLQKPKETQQTNIRCVSESDSVSESESDSVSVSDVCIADKPQKKRASRFTPPSVEEVRAYCFERGNNVDPERFVDFYESKGWTVGKNRMRDWKAAVRNWERTNNDNRPKDIVSQRLEALRNFGGDENDLFN